MSERLAVTIKNRVCLLDIIWKNCDKENWRDLVRQELAETPRRADDSWAPMQVDLASPNTDSSTFRFGSGSLNSNQACFNSEKQTDVVSFNGDNPKTAISGSLIDERTPQESSTYDRRDLRGASLTSPIIAQVNAVSGDDIRDQSTAEAPKLKGKRKRKRSRKLRASKKLKESADEQDGQAGEIRTKYSQKTGPSQSSTAAFCKALRSDIRRKYSQKFGQHITTMRYPSRKQLLARRRSSAAAYYKATKAAKKRETLLDTENSPPSTRKKKRPRDRKRVNYAKLDDDTRSLSPPNSADEDTLITQSETEMSSRSLLFDSLNSILHKSTGMASEDKLVVESVHARSSACEDPASKRFIKLVRTIEDPARSKDQEERPPTKDLGSLTIDNLEVLRNCLIQQIGGLSNRPEKMESDCESLLTELLDSSMATTTDQQDEVDSRNATFTSHSSDNQATLLQSLLAEEVSDQQETVRSMENATKLENENLGKTTDGIFHSEDVVYFTCGVLECKHANPFNLLGIAEKDPADIENRLGVIRRLTKQYKCLLKHGLLDEGRSNIKTRYQELRMEQELLKGYAVSRTSGHLLLLYHPLPDPLQRYCIEHNLLDSTLQDCVLLAKLPDAKSCEAFHPCSDVQARDKRHETLAKVLRQLILRPCLNTSKKLRRKLESHRRLQDKLSHYKDAPGACCSKREKLAFLNVRCCGLTRHIKLLEVI